MKKSIKIDTFPNLNKSEILKKEKNSKWIFKKEDVNGRKIELYKVIDAQLGGKNIYYPNVLIKSFNSDMIVDPYQEKIMSLAKAKKKVETIKFEENLIAEMAEPVFFFIYNSDNYYHFLYDTLPYLILYKDIKIEIPSLKLLVNYSMPGKNTFYRFFYEFLELLGILPNDLLIVNGNTIYKTIYISSSLTHGINSNIEPRKEVYGLYNKLVKKVKEKYNLETPDKFYISRRTWINKDDSNIGTNYTQRRKMINEDQLVASLKKLNIVEIFVENLTTIEKIVLFNNASVIIGAIGGGIANTLFSKSNTKVFCIVSPTFFDINERFKFSLNKTDLVYFNETAHTEKRKLKKHMRVETKKGIIGEILKINKNDIEIGYSNESVAGWNNTFKFNNMKLKFNEFELLDNGLNSRWKINLPNFLSLFDEKSI